MNQLMPTHLLTTRPQNYILWNTAILWKALCTSVPLWHRKWPQASRIPEINKAQLDSRHNCATKHGLIGVQLQFKAHFCSKKKKKKHWIHTPTLKTGTKSNEIFTQPLLVTAWIPYSCWIFCKTNTNNLFRNERKIKLSSSKVFFGT